MPVVHECPCRLAGGEVCVRCARSHQAGALGVQGFRRGDAGQKASAAQAGLGHLYTQESGQLLCVVTG